MCMLIEASIDGFHLEVTITKLQVSGRVRSKTED